MFSTKDSEVLVVKKVGSPEETHVVIHSLKASSRVYALYLRLLFGLVPIKSSGTSLDSKF